MTKRQGKADNNLMKGRPAQPRAVKREQAMITGSGFSAAKLPKLKNAASNLAKQARITQNVHDFGVFFSPVYEARAL